MHTVLCVLTWGAAFGLLLGPFGQISSMARGTAMVPRAATAAESPRTGRADVIQEQASSGPSLFHRHAQNKERSLVLVLRFSRMSGAAAVPNAEGAGPACAGPACGVFPDGRNPTLRL